MISSLLLVSVLTGCPSESVSEASIQNATKIISEEAQTGTLLFSKGDCLVVKIFSRSSYTHVGVIVVEGKKVVVYDSMNGVGVRKLSLEEYLRKQSPDDHLVCHPVKPFTKKQTALFKEHLEKELGRPYGFKHYLTGKRAEGIHCAEYLTDALQKCEIISVKHPARVSPSSLLKGITKYDIYASSKKIPLDEDPIKVEKGRNRCHQLWLNTKACSFRYGRKMKHWFACH